MIDCQQTIAHAQQDFEQAPNLTMLDVAKAKYLGKSGEITQQLRKLGDMTVDERRTLGADIQRAKQAIEQSFEQKKHQLLQQKAQEQLRQEALDITLPARIPAQGGLHPITLTIRHLKTLFHSLGFVLADGPEIETDYYNFTALNIPHNHPARAMHDTFYIDDTHVLRTHTSPIQIRFMEQAKRLAKEPPFKVMAIGKVYRVDSDATHSPMFHQIEGLWIDEQVNFSHLKGILIDFLRQFFADDDLEIRFRPSFFPFTEPSAEIDMRWQGGWLEVGGCGMVHPRVLQQLQVNNTAMRGFAFGLGIERLTMLRYGIDDLRLFFEHDLRFLRQFR